jgi:hypothetical protein
LFLIATIGDSDTLSAHALECRQVKAWRKEHSLGLIPNFPTAALRPPLESYAARQFDEAHVQELIESFQEKDSMNRKGIRVVAISKDLWDTWSTASPEQREELLAPKSKFMFRFFECELGVPTGDHTREAIQRLAASQPQKKKYQVIAKGLKVMICEGNDEDIKMLRLLGNIDNEKRQLQLKLDFPYKIKQMHEAWIGFDTQILKGGKNATLGRAAKTAQLNSWVGQWKMKYEQVYAYSQIGALMGKQWVLAWKIINGLYPNAQRDKSGNPVKLQTNSQLNLIPGMGEGEGNMLMQRVIDGSLDRGDLRKECLKRNAYEEMRKCAIDIINTKTRSDRDIKEGKFTCSNWDDVETKFPVVANKKFLEGWIVSFIGKKKKAPAPPAFVTAISELLDNMNKKLVLRLMIVLVPRPLFMNRPSRLSPSLCRRNPLWPTSISLRSRLCTTRTMASL